MGSSLCICFLGQLDKSNWIDIIGIIVNGIIAIWLVHTIQVNTSNRRTLKDHFINEVKELRDEYRKWMSYYYNKDISPNEVIPCFKLLSIKANNCLDHISLNYSIDKEILKPYILDLPDIITNSDEFTANFKRNVSFKLSNDTQIKLLKFQQEYNGIFNNIIVSINDH